MIEVNAPERKEDLARDLQKVYAESIAFENGLETSGFFSPLATAWSASENVRHLNKSIRGVAKALRLPKFIFRLMFGAADKPSCNYGEMKEIYQHKLAQGAKAGYFAPSPEHK